MPSMPSTAVSTSCSSATSDRRATRWLSRTAQRARGLLVMGPDCGTAVVAGVGLGFANVVRPGPVGIVAASGTGAQQLMSLLDDAGIGVAHCLGVGGRDLSSAVEGRSTFAAIERLAADDAVELIVVISKPPAAEVAATLRDRAKEVDTPVLVRLLGPGQPDLTQTAAAVAESLGRPWSRADSARSVARAATGRPARAVLRRDPVRRSHARRRRGARRRLVQHPARRPASPRRLAHAVGTSRLHRLRRRSAHRRPAAPDDRRNDPQRRIGVELADPECAVVLLDVVLGHGAHRDPADELAPLIATARKPVIVSLVGTRDDPQGRDQTAARLVEAGAVVHASNAAAAREAVRLVSEGAS